MSVFEKAQNQPQGPLWGCAIFENVHTSANFLKLDALWHGQNHTIYATSIYHNGSVVQRIFKNSK